MTEDQDVKHQDKSGWLELADGGGVLFVDPSAPPVAKPRLLRHPQRRASLIESPPEE